MKRINSMAKNWETDKGWSDKFLPEIKQILGLYLIGEPPVEEDRYRNTDLMVLKMDAVRIGCRVRRSVTERGYQTLKRHNDEFTIRAGRPSGAKTELAKVVEGWGDYFFYGFASADTLCHWTLCNLNEFRGWFTRYIATHKGEVPGIGKVNKDGSSDFKAFKFSALPRPFIVAKEWGDMYEDIVPPRDDTWMKPKAPKFEQMSMFQAPGDSYV